VACRGRWQADPHRRRVSAEERKRRGSTAVLWRRQPVDRLLLGTARGPLIAPVAWPHIVTRHRDDDDAIVPMLAVSRSASSVTP